MHTSISGPDEIRKNGVRESIASRLMQALRRPSQGIGRVDVVNTDENSSPSGIEKHCRIRIQMPGAEPFVLTTKGEYPWVAVSRAAKLARRKVMTKLKRPKSQRERFRRNRRQENDSPYL